MQTVCIILGMYLDFYSLSGKTSYLQISWNLEAAGLEVIMIVSPWNLTGISAALSIAEVPVKFKGDWKSLNVNLAALKTSQDLKVRDPSAEWIEALNCHWQEFLYWARNHATE